MSERVSENESADGPSAALSLRWPLLVLALCATIVVFHMCVRASSEALASSELEHAHAAWLLHSGDLPYLDFFEIHPPYFWWSLRPAFALFGEGMAVFYWGRAMMIAAFLGSSLLLGLLGRAWFGTVVGIAATTIALVGRFAQRPAIHMGPDGPAVFLLLLGIYLAWRAWTQGFRRLGALVAGGCLGLALATHHQVAYSLVALALAAAWSLQTRREWHVLRERAVAAGLFLAGLVLPILLPFVLYGIERTFHHTHVLPAGQLPTFEPWGRFGAFFVGDFALLPFALLSLATCLLVLSRRPASSATSLALVLLVAFNAVGIILMPRPLTHVFILFVPFVALLAARTVPVVLEALGPQHRSFALSLFIAAGVMSNMDPRRWGLGSGLEENADYLAWAADFIPAGETYAGQLLFHPVYVRDGSPYWTDLDLETLQASDGEWAFDLLAHLQASRPFLVHQLVNERGTGGPEEAQRIREYLRETYERVDGTELLRRKP